MDQPTGEHGAKTPEEIKKTSLGLFCDERGYLNQVAFILEHGRRKGDRTGTGVISVFGTQARYSLRGKPRKKASHSFNS